MEPLMWSISNVERFFRLNEKIKSRQTIFNAEERGEIPTARRVPRGRTLVRQWHLSQLPEIGLKYGFLKKPKQQKIICIYTAKGGVLKTTISYCLARALALNGIKTLIIGLDIQCSITDIVIQKDQAESLEEFENKPMGLYHYLFEKKKIKNIIQNTVIPTLDIIPESTDLNVLEKKLRLEPRREYIFKDRLIPNLKEYDVIIFDNSPSWNQLIENALTAANTIFSPIGCDIGTYQALTTNLETINEFKTALHLQWDNFYLIPTLLEKTKLSQQIYGAYLNQYSDKMLGTPIRRAIKGQEAIVLNQSPIESDPSSSLAQDYYEFLSQAWNKINLDK